MGFLIRFRQITVLAIAGALWPGKASEPRIFQTNAPIFPASLEASGFSYGEVHILIRVDARGQLTDYLVTAYTRKPFAEAAVAALQTWTFAPARENGQVIGWMREIRVIFQTSGGSIVIDNVDHPAGKLSLLNDPDDKLDYHDYALRDLDRIPSPLRARAPAGHPQTRVVIAFYIDEHGMVRMPTIEQGAGDPFAQLASAAISEWRFARPTRKGHPVLVRASQVFGPRP